MAYNIIAENEDYTIVRLSDDIPQEREIPVGSTIGEGVDKDPHRTGIRLPPYPQGARHCG